MDVHAATISAAVKNAEGKLLKPRQYIAMEYVAGEALDHLNQQERVADS